MPKGAEFHTFHTFHTPKTTSAHRRAGAGAQACARVAAKVWKVWSMEVRKNRWAWMREAMPGVAKLIAEKRAQWGDAHVTDCITRSLAGEAGLFFAREGPVAVGTPWAGDPVLANFAAAQVTSTQALVLMRNPDHG